MEGIIPALESAHAVSAARKVARGSVPTASSLVNVSGRGDKDVDQVRRMLAEVEAPRRAASAPRRAGGRAMSRNAQADLAAQRRARAAPPADRTGSPPPSRAAARRASPRSSPT